MLYYHRIAGSLEIEIAIEIEPDNEFDPNTDSDLYGRMALAGRLFLRTEAVHYTQVKHGFTYSGAGSPELQDRRTIISRRL